MTDPIVATIVAKGLPYVVELAEEALDWLLEEVFGVFTEAQITVEIASTTPFMVYSVLMPSGALPSLLEWLKGDQIVDGKHQIWINRMGPFTFRNGKERYGFASIVQLAIQVRKQQEA